MPEPNGRDIFNEPSEVKSIGFHDRRYVSERFVRPNKFGIKQLDFGMKRVHALPKDYRPPETSILRHGADSTDVRPEAARFFMWLQDSKERLRCATKNVTAPVRDHRHDKTFSVA